MANITDNILDFANIYADIATPFVPQEHMENWEQAIDSPNPPYANTPEYHQWAAEDLTKEMSKKIADVPYVGNLGAAAFELAAPALSLWGLPYDVASGISRYGWAKEYEDPKYTTDNKWEKIPGLEGTDFAGILNAIDMEDPLSATWNRFLGAGKPVFNRLFNKKRRDEGATQQGIAKALMQKKIREAAETFQKAKAVKKVVARHPPSEYREDRPSTPISVPVPAHISGGEASEQRGSMPTGTAGRNPWGRAHGGLIDIPLPGRSRDI